MVGFLPFSFKELWALEVLVAQQAAHIIAECYSYRTGGCISTNWGSVTCAATQLQGHGLPQHTEHQGTSLVPPAPECPWPLTKHPPPLLQSHHGGPQVEPR